MPGFLDGYVWIDRDRFCQWINPKIKAQPAKSATTVTWKNSAIIEVQSPLLAMTIATKKLTLAEYLAYHDGTDNRYELVEGELKLMAVGTGQHGDVVEFLHDNFRDAIRQAQFPWAAKQGLLVFNHPVVVVGIPVEFQM